VKSVSVQSVAKSGSYQNDASPRKKIPNIGGKKLHAWNQAEVEQAEPRRAQVRAWRAAGLTWLEIAQRLGVTRQRAGQLGRTGSPRAASAAKTHQGARNSNQRIEFDADDA